MKLKKTYIVLGIILLIIAGTVIAQSLSDTCSVCLLLKNIVAKLTSIDNKICKNVNIQFPQRTNHEEILEIPTVFIGSPLKETLFIITPPEIEGTLVSLDKIRFAGVINATANYTQTEVSCDLFVNGNHCYTLTKMTEPCDCGGATPAYFYEDISSCLNDLDVNKVNLLSIKCASVDERASLFGIRITYDATWNSCINGV